MNKFIPKNKDEMWDVINKEHPFPNECQECEAPKEVITPFKTRKIELAPVSMTSGGVTQYQKHYKCKECGEIQDLFYHLSWVN